MGLQGFVQAFATIRFKLKEVGYEIIVIQPQIWDSLSCLLAANSD